MTYRPGPEDDSHLVVADTRPLPSLDEVKDYWDEVLRRDVADQALCGWKLPGKHFSRMSMFQEERPGTKLMPDQICRRCIEVMLEYDLEPERVCLVPPESWDGWDDQD